MRTHPAVIAQAAATSAELLDGRFALGVGTGENLNEHIIGAHWPPTDVRLDMLHEAIEVIRELWTGEITTHHGPHYTVENARIYTLPDDHIPILVSAFGEKALKLAAEVGEGWMTTKPDGEMRQSYRQQGGTGPTQAGMKVCWAEDESAARKTAHSLWPTSGVSGELSQELPMPAHFEQASELVTEDKVAEAIACGPDPEVHAAAIRKYLDAGFDQIFINQVGSDQAGFFRFYQEELAPLLAL
jgi:G6PDH family F420-dependent oxidoreductase